jgi:HEAT repeat protein
VNTNTVSELVALLQDKDRGIRASAAKELGESFDPDAVPALIAVLKDQDTEVRSNAVSALKELSGFVDQDAVSAAVPALIDAIKDKGEYVPGMWSDPETVSKAASWALGEIDPEGARQTSEPSGR